MRVNLTKKEVREVPTLELAIRFNRLMLKGELLSAREITVGDARETLYIEDELRRRLIKQLGRDPYPPDRVEEEKPSNYMISLLKSRQSKPKPESKIVNYEKKVEGRFSFKITIVSSIGSVVARQNVKVDSKSDANIKAVEMIDKLGLKKATYKIS